MKTSLEAGLILALTIRGLAVTSYPAMREVAGRAESLGFDSIWLCDHFLTLPADDYAQDAGFGGSRGVASRVQPRSVPLLECWTTLSALSRDTERLRLGTSVLCNSYRTPSVLAKMAATLDVISEGRLELGLGAGWFAHEYAAYGIPFPPIGTRIAQLAEGIEVIRRMWSDEAPAFAGSHYTIDGAVCDPRPRQSPAPPIWIGGEGDRVHRVAARCADGINVRWWSPEQMAARGSFLEAACREVNREPASLGRSVTLLLAVDGDGRRARDIRDRFASIPGPGVIAGTPEQCVRRLRPYLEAGVRHFLFTIPDVATSESLELAGREVVPALRAELAANRRSV
jgi:probable F420-dependent oxidoreductase